MAKITPKADLFFECSWEVANKVGGIYTVVKSKAAMIKDYYGEDYTLIGPYFPDKNIAEFQEAEAPEECKPICEDLKKKGIFCHFGKWLIKGEPKVILIDFQKLIDNKAQILEDYWNHYKIDSLNSPWDYEEPVIWSTAVGMVLEKIANHFKEKKIVAQFHEWMSSAALLYLKKNKVNVGTVFTTHATMLGRSIAGSGRDLYSMLGKFNPEKEAYNLQIQSKFHMEKVSAQNTDIFTTVSEITGLEAEHILGRKPDVLLPNGLDMERFPTFEETSIKHKTARGRIRDMLSFYFFPYESFDLGDILIFYIFGRYEYHNKGIDLLIEALGKLNQKLKESKEKKTIVTFFWIPTATHGIKQELLENKSFYHDIFHDVDDYMADIRRKLVNAIILEQNIKNVDLFDKPFKLKIKEDMLNFRKKGSPPHVTHNLFSESDDPIFNNFKRVGLKNKSDDRVKVIFHPAYLNGVDGLLDIPYYDAMCGGHLGIYPSYYEPWGYTPLESAAMGVPAITTDLAGFGRWIASKTDQKKKPGIFVLPRHNQEWNKSVAALTDHMYYYSSLSKNARVRKKIEAKKLSNLADWKILISNYIKAHNLAVDKLDRA